MLITILKMKTACYRSTSLIVLSFFLISLFPQGTSAVSARPWALHGLSILFPLPETLPSNPDFSGLTEGMPEQFAEVMQVVGVRFEKNVIRLVWQPLMVQVLLPIETVPIIFVTLGILVAIRRSVSG